MRRHRNGCGLDPPRDERARPDDEAGFDVSVAPTPGGAAVGIALMVAKGADTKYAVPFGPFLSLAAVAYLFFGAAFFNFLMFHRLF